MPDTMVALLHRAIDPPLASSAYLTAACERVGNARLVSVNKPYSVAHARNFAVRCMYDRDCDSLLMVDEDVMVQPDCIALLRELDTDIAVGQVPAVRKLRGLHIPYINVITGDNPITGELDEFEFRWLKESRPISRAGTACMLIKRHVFGIGLEPAKFSGHSLRAGFVTSAARAGIATHLIRQQTGHASDATMSRYIREGSLFRGNAAGQLL